MRSHPIVYADLRKDLRHDDQQLSLNVSMVPTFGEAGAGPAYEGQKGKIRICPNKMYDEDVGVEAQANHDEGDGEERPTHGNQDDASVSTRSCWRRHGLGKPFEVLRVMEVGGKVHCSNSRNPWLFVVPLRGSSGGSGL